MYLDNGRDRNAGGDFESLEVCSKLLAIIAARQMTHKTGGIMINRI